MRKVKQKKRICALCEKRPVANQRSKRELTGRCCMECAQEIMILEKAFSDDAPVMSVFDSMTNLKADVIRWIDESSSIGVSNV
jgi:hypothetical protein